MTLKRKIAIFSALLSLSYSITLIQTTYAKYVSSAEANSNINIARWNITINDQDIIQNSNFTNGLTPIFENNQFIKEGVIAPTSEGYFDIIIDGSNTDVSFEYTITINPSDNDTIQDLKIVKYTIDDIEYNYIDEINNTINHDDEIKIKTIRVYFTWDDDINTQTMDNQADTIATINGNANYRVSVNLIQKNSQSN